MKNNSVLVLVSSKILDKIDSNENKSHLHPTAWYCSKFTWSIRLYFKPHDHARGLEDIGPPTPWEGKKLEFLCICEKYGFSNKVINTTWKFLSPWLHFVLQCRIQSSLHHYRIAAYIGWPTDSSRIFPVWLRPSLPCNEWEDRSVSTGFDHSCGKTKHLAEGKVKAQLNKC